MRTFIVFFGMGLFLIVTLPVYLIVKLIGCFNKYKCAVISQKIISWAFKRLMFLAGAKITVIGRDNIPKNKAVLYVANHRSYADIPMGYTTVAGPTGFIAKKAIKKIPIFSWWMVNMNCLFLDRDDIRQGLKTILTAVDNVKAGYSAFIMPEGTRNHNNEMLPFKEGSFKIAEKSGCPIVPVAISNSDALYELHKPWIRSAKVVIHYGEPIETIGMSREEKKELAVNVQKRIANMLEMDKVLWKK